MQAIGAVCPAPRLAARLHVRCPGQKSVQWDGRNNHGEQVASGIYFYRLQADDRFVDQKKMILLK